MFIQYLETSFSEIIVVFYITKVDTVQGCIAGFHMCIIISEILFPSYLGNLVENTGEKLAISIYNCNWIDQTITFQRTLHIMIIRANREHRLFAGNLIPISWESFLKVSLTMFPIKFICFFLYFRCRKRFILTIHF